jgi:MFS family permease
VRETPRDIRRWLALVVALSTALIVAIDTMVLIVAIPTMLRDLDTTLPTLQWVLSGYSLTFAALLVVGGRLGDVFGHRRVLMIGLSCFITGSALATLATSAGQLILARALLEGTGAALMAPTSLAMVSKLFQGTERAKAFGAWGATGGIGAAIAPLIGGYLTTNHSWRWCFGSNAVLCLLALIGAFFTMDRDDRSARRPRMDIPGALLATLGLVLLVFALGQGPTYGWWAPLRALTVLGVELWPATAPVSAIPLLLVVVGGAAVAFVRLERAREQVGGDPLFSLGLLRLPSYRYGMVCAFGVSMGQLGVTLLLPLFLQGAKDLSAQTNGLWLVPMGVAGIIGAQLSAWLVPRIGTTRVVQLGFGGGLLSIVGLLAVLDIDIGFVQALPSLLLMGCGGAGAHAQLTALILADVPARMAGVAGGTSSAVRQVGTALGVSLMSTLLTTQTVRAALDRLDDVPLGADTRAQAAAGIRDAGHRYRPPASFLPREADAVGAALDRAMVTGTRITLLVAAAVMLAALGASLLLPRQRPAGAA